mgnify:CR=1 FL=1
MTSTTPDTPAPPPARPEPPAGATVTAAAVVWQEVAAWRRLTHALGDEVRRRLIPLVRANLVPLDVACQILQRAGLPPLPRRWAVQLAPAVTRRASATSPDQAVQTFRDELHLAVRQALGPAAIIAFDQPPQARATGPRDSAGRRPYDLWSQPVITATVRADTGDRARTTAVTRLLDELAGLVGVTADLDNAARVQVEPDEHTPVELDVDADAPFQPHPLPPLFGMGQLTEARTARHLAMQVRHHLAGQLRAALIDALVTGDLDAQPGRHAPYGLIDDLLRDLGLPGLPHAHQYEITTAIRLTVTADNPQTARVAAYRILRDASATCPQFGLPITVSSTHRDPEIVADGERSFQVTWHHSYLVCLRAAHCTQLAEQAVRLQLSVLADELPQIGTVPLTTVYLGEHVDHRLDPDRD